MNRTFRFAVSALIVVLLIYVLDVREIYDALKGANILLLTLFMAVHFFASLLLNALNVKIILHAMKIKLPYLEVLRAYTIAYSIGQFSPGKLGEISIAYLLRNRGLNLGSSGSLIIMDKMITVITFGIFAIVGFFIFFPSGQAVKASILLVLVVATLIGLISSVRIRKIIKRYILRKYSRYFKGFHRNLSLVMRTGKRLIALNFSLTVVRLLIAAWMTYLSFTLVFNIDLSYYIVPIITASGLIVALIPISLSGLGVTESVGISLYALIGVPAVITGTIMLTLRMFYFLMAGIIMLVYFLSNTGGGST